MYLKLVNADSHLNTNRNLGGCLMKKTNYGLLFVLSGAMILASCGGANTPKAKKYNLTFHQTEPGEIEDVVVVVTKGKTTNPDVWEQEPDINPKVGYTSEWEEYDVETMTADLTVVPVYTTIQYTATFIDRVSGQTLGTDQFTVEDESLDYPSLPTEVGYTYAWESVTISAQNLTVYCDRTANLHTVTFYADEEKTEQVGEPLTFSIETTSLDLPEVPEKTGMDGSWPEIDFACDHDLELVAQYALHSYYLQFKVNGENVGSPVGYNVSDAWGSIIKPNTPEITGYTVAWPVTVELLYAEQDNPQVINAEVTANQYTVRYEGSQETTSVTYDSPYQLLDPTAIYDWYLDDECIPLSGDRWTIASDVTLSKISIDFKLIDFENESMRLFTPSSNTELSIDQTQGVNGSKALKASCKDNSGSLNINLNKDYLAKVFEDPSVKSLAFYAKGSITSSKFRARPTAIFYEQDGEGFGISTNYKVFYLTRSTYNEMVSANDYMFAQYYPGGETGLDLYLDNFRICYTDYTTYTSNGFENGRYYKNSDTNWIYRHAKNNQADFQITGSASNSIGSSELDYSVFSEGVSSIKVVKTAAQVNFYFGGSSNFKPANLPDEGIYVDFRSDNRWNESWHETSGSVTVGSLSTGTNGTLVYPFAVSAPASRSGVTNIAGQWQTFHLKKSDITNDGRFLIMPGGATGATYVDNIRFATGPIDSFENAYAYQAGLENNVVAGASSYPVSEHVGTAPVPLTKSDYIFTTEWGNVNEGRIPDASITDERASDGNYSLKLSMPNTKPLRLRPSYLQMLIRDGGKLTFDVYSDDLADNKLSFTTLGGNVKSITKGQWTTIELELADFLKSGATTYHTEGRFTEGAFGVGTIYVDNIRYIPAV